MTNVSRLIQVTDATSHNEPEEGYYWFVSSLNPRPIVERVYRRQDGALIVSTWCLWQDVAKCFTHWAPEPLDVPTLDMETC